MGRGRARTLGYPTINLHNINTVPAEDGVYAARVTINDGIYKAVMFVGASPTFNDKEKSVELHLIGLGQKEIKQNHLDQLIPTKISVETVGFIRQVKKFNTKKELIRNIKKDVEEAVAILTSPVSVYSGISK